MATVQVNNFAEFVSAVAVSGNTVVLPVKAVWDMNNEYPEGYTSDIPINCASINGNGTEIRNLHLYGKFIVPADLEMNDLLMTNTVCEGTAFFDYGSAARTLSMNGCIMTGIYGLNTTAFCKSRLTLNRSVLHLDMTAGGYGAILIADDYTAQYSRISAQYPQSAGGSFSFGSKAKFCMFTIQYLGCRVFFSRPLSGCVVQGNFGEAYDGDQYGDHGAFVSVYDSAAMSDEFTTDNPYFKAVTHEQLYDAAYLQSIGFPIGA